MSELVHGDAEIRSGMSYEAPRVQQHYKVHESILLRMQRCMQFSAQCPAGKLVMSSKIEVASNSTDVGEGENVTLELFLWNEFLLVENNFTQTLFEHHILIHFHFCGHTGTLILP